ncbi:MAG: hypothetical protein SFU98_11315 [Leptospiraceae bacterium]|nr:hypothetical protein [Leptospiraceae bacterium]
MPNLVKKIRSYYKFLFQYDKDITNKILQQSHIGMNYLAFIAIFGNSYFATTDFIDLNQRSAFIRLFLILVCALYSIFHKNLSKLSFDSGKLVMAILFTLEIETQLVAIDIPFYDPLTWAILPCLAVFHAFYFNGVPGKFFLYWSGLIIYYYLRVALSDKS